MSVSNVVQLRIHGVGGATPEGLLGLPPGTETIRLAGDEAAGFYARPLDPHVQGYVWWKLTSGLGAALWIVLLPFTLFNVGNWMFPPEGVKGWHPARPVCRFLMFLLGLSLTLAYVLWEFDLLVQQVFYQWWSFGEPAPPVGPCACLGPTGPVRPPQLPGWLRGPLPPYLEQPWTFRAAVGMLAFVAVGILVYVVARRTRTDFEEYSGPWPGGAPGLEPPPGLLGFPLRAPRGLKEKFFWSHSKDSKRQLWIHMLAGAAMFFALVAWTLPHAHAHDPALGLGPWFEWLVGAQLVILMLLLVSYLAGWGLNTKFKIAPPVIVATASVALTTGFFSGFTFWLAHRLHLGTQDSLEINQVGAFGFGAIVLAISLAVLLWALWHGRLGELDRLMDERDPAGGGLPANTRHRGQEQDGVTPAMLRRVALARSLSTTLEKIDWLLTPAALAYLGFAFAFAMPFLLLHHSVPRWLGGLSGLGAWLLTLAVGYAAPALLFRSFRPSANSKVKTLWDAITFWPRRFHPLAVRPYGERAVPEIEGRLHELTKGQEHRVVIAAHSQGSVLMYCALVHLAAWEAEDPGVDVIRRISLVTFGSPLRRMHYRYFPAYFAYPDDFADLRDRLFNDAGPEVAWANFYRQTDYVGQGIFGGMEPSVGDHLLSDPPQTPSRGSLPIDQAAPVPPDARPPIFTKLSFHSLYNNTDELREWVDGTVEPALEG